MRYVVVPCQLDENGKIVPSRSPHGYHHILKVYLDGSYMLVATVTVKVMEIQLLAIAQIVADGKPVEVNGDFYQQS